MLKDFKTRITGQSTFFSIMALLTLTLLIFFTSQILAQLIVGLISVFKHHDFSQAVQWSLDSPIAQFIMTSIAEGLMVWLVWKVIKRQGITFKQIGLSKIKSDDVLYGIFGFITFYLILLIIFLPLVKMIFPAVDINQQQDVGFTILHSNLDRLLAFFSLVIIPPIAEEILMRGYLFSGLRRSLKFIPAAVITSSLFGLGHLLTGKGGSVIVIAALNTFLLSLGLTYLREKTGRVWAGVVMHSVNNLLAFIVLFYN